MKAMIHKWVVKYDTLGNYYYQCKKCHFETLPSVPLPLPQSKECK